MIGELNQQVTREQIVEKIEIKFNNFFITSLALDESWRRQRKNEMKKKKENERERDVGEAWKVGDVPYGD